MPSNVKQETSVKNLTEKHTRTSGRKAPGTRIGVIFDWRVASTKPGRLADRYGRSLRDGSKSV